jgi:hypothetical protein
MGRVVEWETVRIVRLEVLSKPSPLCLAFEDA